MLETFESQWKHSNFTLKYYLHCNVNKKEMRYTEYSAFFGRLNRKRFIKKNWQA